jgi:hypothetical protein
MKARKGQVAIYLVVAIVALAILALLNVDTFLAVRSKNRLQHSGDAAAIAAARKQALLLNKIGELNIEHIKAALRNDKKKCDEIVLRQKRLALLGPLEALKLSSDAAIANGAEVRPEFSAILEKHVLDILDVYAGGNGESDPYPEPYPGAWLEYADTLSMQIMEGLAAGPDNVEFYNALGSHLLLNRQFYHAIDGRNWCWFHFNCPDILESYRDFHDWEPLPSAEQNSYDNSEIFSLHVRAVKAPLSRFFSAEELLVLLQRYAKDVLEEGIPAGKSLIYSSEETWFFFDTSRWRMWFDGLTLAGEEGGVHFPFVGEIKEEYNVRGAASICRCVSKVDSFAADDKRNLTWSAAAKPFGTITDFDGRESRVTSLNAFIVPAFSDVRLVAIDAVGGANLATADADWIFHVRAHLPSYMESGHTAMDCFYCKQLRTWEKESFRRTGSTWLKFNSHTCVRPEGGGGGSGGGTSHGH